MTRRAKNRRRTQGARPFDAVLLAIAAAGIDTGNAPSTLAEALRAGAERLGEGPGEPRIQGIARRIAEAALRGWTPDGDERPPIALALSLRDRRRAHHAPTPDARAALGNRDWWLEHDNAGGVAPDGLILGLDADEVLACGIWIRGIGGTRRAPVLVAAWGGAPGDRAALRLDRETGPANAFDVVANGLGEHLLAGDADRIGLPAIARWHAHRGRPRRPTLDPKDSGRRLVANVAGPAGVEVLDELRLVHTATIPRNPLPPRPEPRTAPNA